MSPAAIGMSRLFTLIEAESLLPEIEPVLRQAMETKPRFREAEAELQAYVHRINMSGGSLVNMQKVAELQSRRQAAASELKVSLQKIQQYGVEVKDLDSGLLDFPTHYRDRLVYLCWKLGEEHIRFWHTVEAGFAGRQPIDDDFRANHQGGRPS